MPPTLFGTQKILLIKVAIYRKKLVAEKSVEVLIQGAPPCHHFQNNANSLIDLLLPVNPLVHSGKSDLKSPWYEYE